jgi:hypothetical protein
MSETVEVKVQLNRKVFEVLKYYIPLTSYGVGLSFEEALSPWINECLKQDLEAETLSNCENAGEQIAENLKAMLDLENKVEIPAASYRHLEKIALKENKTVDQLVEEEVYKIIKGSKAEAS